MAKAIIKLYQGMDSGILFGYDSEVTLATARRALAEHNYLVCEAIDTDLTGMDAAEEMFDLTNNPGRQAEREALYGRGPSLSKGDIVEVEGVNYVCCSMGWEVL